MIHGYLAAFVQLICVMKLMILEYNPWSVGNLWHMCYARSLIVHKQALFVSFRKIFPL